MNLSTVTSFENIWPGMIGWFLAYIQIQLQPQGHNGQFASGSMQHIIHYTCNILKLLIILKITWQLK